MDKKTIPEANLLSSVRLGKRSWPKITAANTLSRMYILRNLATSWASVVLPPSEKRKLDERTQTQKTHGRWICCILSRYKANPQIFFICISTLQDTLHNCLSSVIFWHSKPPQTFVVGMIICSMQIRAHSGKTWCLCWVPFSEKN
jgi:hypothetical protein